MLCRVPPLDDGSITSVLRPSFDSAWTLIEENAVTIVDLCGGVVRLTSALTTAEDVQYTIERMSLSGGEGLRAKAFIFDGITRSKSRRRDFLDSFAEKVAA